ncbi:MAG: amidohydrolase family protein [Acidimicrobiia bacterium]
MTASEGDRRRPVWDVHAHYMPPEAIDPMGDGMVQVRLETVGGAPDSITVNGMPVGATIHQISDTEGIIAATDRAGIDVRVLSPPPFTYRYWNDPDASLDLCRLLNDATAEVVRAHPNRFRGLATVPLQDTDASIHELRRARDELGLVGVTIGTNVAGANVSDPSRRPFLAEAAANGMPILVHPDFVPTPRLDHYYLVNLIGLPTESAITMGNMIFSGLFDELPELRVCFMHGGGSAPFLFGRWDTGWRVRPESRVDTALRPTDYLANIYCDTLTHSPLALSHLVEVLGAKNVVIGTDMPFDVEDPDPLDHLRRAPRLSEDDVHTIESMSPVQWLTGLAPEGHIP